MKNLFFSIVISLALIGLVVAFQNFNSSYQSQENFSEASSAATGNLVLVDDSRFVEKCSQLMPKCPDINLSCPVSDKPMFMKEAENVAETHVYEKQMYDCDDYSRELARRLKSDGYEAYYCQGTYSNDASALEHAWVKVVVYIEATSGKILDPLEYRAYSERFCQ